MKRYLLFILAIIAITGTLTVAASTVTNPGIIVIDADSRLDMSVTQSTGAESVLNLVADRLFVQWANSMRHIGLAQVPNDLSTLLESVAPRIYLQWANSARHIDLDPVPGTLDALLGQVPGRLFIQWANSVKTYELAYPCDLFGDNAAPIMTNLSARQAGTSMAVSWNTDEVAGSLLRVGTQSGIYNQTIGDSLLVTEHEVVVPGLELGVPYYYRAESTDRCGYTAESAERQFELQEQSTIYLPVIKR